MNHVATPAIILSRIDFGEADRIITMLTPEHGKLRLIAKGVRRVKSKLAGGIELFSVSDITYIPGRGEIGTLVSTRLQIYFSHIVQDLDRTMLGYELIKQLHKITEDEAESEYFELLEQAFAALNDPAVLLPLIRFWFQAQILRLGGHTPNLQTDTAGNKLDATKAYDFSLEAMCLVPRDHGKFAAPHIKFLRLVFAGNSPKLLAQVQGSEQLVEGFSSQLAAIFLTHGIS